MELEIKTLVDPETLEPRFTVKPKGGYDFTVLPKEYIAGEHFIVNAKSITFRAKMNPLTGNVCDEPVFTKVKFDAELTSEQVERIIYIMKICGDRLCRIKRIQNLGEVVSIQI